MSKSYNWSGSQSEDRRKDRAIQERNKRSQRQQKQKLHEIDWSNPDEVEDFYEMTEEDDL